jgi:hypothetical protein
MSRFRAVLALLLATAGCETAEPPYGAGYYPSYFVDRICSEAGLTPGTEAFEVCVERERLRQLRSIYDLGLRASPRTR